jgi:integrase
MASLRRKPGTRFWIACFTDSAGVQRQRSTKTLDRKLALRAAEAFEVAYRSRQTEFQIRRVFSDIHEEVHGKPLSDLTTAKYAEQWLARKKGEVEIATFRSYSATVPEFVSHLGPLALQPPLAIRKGNVEAYRDDVAKRVSARTANNKLKVVRTFLSSAWEDDLIQDNPAAKVRVLKAEDVIRRSFTLDELRKVIDQSAGEWTGMTLFGFYTGQRLKDIAEMTWARIDLDGGALRFSTSKTERSMSIPLAAPLLAWLRSQDAGAGDRPVFPKAYATMLRTHDTGQLSDQFYEILVKAGLTPPRPKSHKASGVGRDGKRQRNPLTFHSLRHTATSFLRQRGVSDAIVRDIIGHDSVEVSREYTHIEDRPKRAALNKLPDIWSA